MKTNGGCRIFLVLMLSCLAGAGTLRSDIIVIKGSDTLVKLNERWAEVYQAENPGVDIRVTGGGSSLGIAALFEKDTDIAASSRKLKHDEVEGFKQIFGSPPLELVVAMDGLAVYVHDKNPVRDVTISELKRIFTGRTTNWKEVGGRDQRINLYSRNTLSGTYAFFKEHVLEDEEFSNQAQMLPSTSLVMGSLSRDIRGVGYGGIGYLSGAMPLGIAMDADTLPITPSRASVLNGEYPLSRPLYFYLSKDSLNHTTTAFLRWVIDTEGQSVVEREHYYPLSASRREAMLALLNPTKSNTD